MKAASCYGMMTKTSFFVDPHRQAAESKRVMKYQAVIFDIDGTLLDSVDLHAEAWRQVFGRHGRDIPFDQIRAQIGKGSDQLLPVFLSREEVEESGEKLTAERSKLFKQEFMPRVKPFPGVRPLFERLQGDGYKLALASSATKKELERYAKLLEIEDLIDGGASTDDAEKSKPEPDIFEAAVRKLSGVPTGTCLAVGDTPYDAEAAGKIGIRTVGVLCGGFPEADLRRAGAFAIFQGPEDLLRRYDETPFAAR